MKSEIKSYDNGSFAALGLMGNETQSPSVARRRLVFFLPEAGKQSGGGLTDGWTAAGCVGCFTPLPLRPPPTLPLCGGPAEERAREGVLRSVQVVHHARFGSSHMTGCRRGGGGGGGAGGWGVFTLAAPG